MSSWRWSTDFLQPNPDPVNRIKRALIILNQPFSQNLLERLWNATKWHACADGGANRLYDVLDASHDQYLPSLIKGDLDSLRNDVKVFYAAKGVPIIHDPDQNSTDLMKCLNAIEDLEREEGGKPYEVILLGGLSGRLDQTIHILSLLHKLRTKRAIFATTDENVGWVLDSGEHHIEIDHHLVGETCGLLPVGIDSSVITTRGLRWDLEQQESGFSGLTHMVVHGVAPA